MRAIERRGVSLRALNSFGVEARAARLIEIDDTARLARLAGYLRGEPAPLLLGGGSNILFTRDPSMPVVRIAIRGRRLLSDDSRSVVVEAGAGENWNEFVDWTLAQGCCGLENLSLIPGTVGASPIQNIGAYGVEMREHFESLDAVSLLDGSHRRFDAADCGFGYRDSVFRQPQGRGWAIAAVRFRLARAAPLQLDYGEIRDELRDSGIARPAAGDVARAVSAIRRRKLPDPAVLGNAGSFFRNPIVEASIADALSALHPAMPRFAVSADEAATDRGARVKLSAGWLIERCGWKGFRDGDAGVHERHALVLVNHGNATGAQVYALARRIAESVHDRFGIELAPEPTIV